MFLGKSKALQYGLPGTQNSTLHHFMHVLCHHSRDSSYGSFKNLYRHSSYIVFGQDCSKLWQRLNARHYHHGMCHHLWCWLPICLGDDPMDLSSSHLVARWGSIVSKHNSCWKETAVLHRFHLCMTCRAPLKTKSCCPMVRSRCGQRSPVHPGRPRRWRDWAPFGWQLLSNFAQGSQVLHASKSGAKHLKLKAKSAW